MYDVPANLDPSQYLNSTCIQVAIGEFQIQLHFQPDASIAIEGRWQIRDGTGRIVDQFVENELRETYRVHVLLGQTVIDSSVSAPDSFSLTFENQYVLTVFDDSQQFESCHLSPSGVII